MNASDIAIYPNPTDNVVTVSSSKQPITTLQIVDVNGKIVADYSYTNSKKETVSLSKLTPGVYMIKVNGSVTKIVSKVQAAK
jgi:hypothetical protein